MRVTPTEIGQARSENCSNARRLPRICACREGHCELEDLAQDSDKKKARLACIEAHRGGIVVITTSCQEFHRDRDGSHNQMEVAVCTSACQYEGDGSGLAKEERSQLHPFLKESPANVRPGQGRRTGREEDWQAGTKAIQTPSKKDTRVTREMFCSTDTVFKHHGKPGFEQFGTL